ncbi:MAG: DUF1844 domain-containing protein [Candidatus Hermodarchaeota archaeon]|nr:DUF1844 domain-containing protein [Candidatus Hermodarchaeota archaeon]
MPKGKKKKQPKNKEPAPEPKIEDPSTEEKAESEPVMVDIAALPVWQLIPLFINILERVAWQKMGLVVNPQTQEIEKDLQQARVAIDSYTSLLEHLGDHVEPDMKTVLKARLTDLKLNFAKQA